MASLHHPNLVTVLDMLTEDDDLFLVMEYVPGGTLSEVLAEAPLAPARTLELLRPVAAALDHAHADGIVHRDVKPANVRRRRTARSSSATWGSRRPPRSPGSRRRARSSEPPRTWRPSRRSPCRARPRPTSTPSRRSPSRR